MTRLISRFTRTAEFTVIAPPYSPENIIKMKHIVKPKDIYIFSNKPQNVSVDSSVKFLLILKFKHTVGLFQEGPHSVLADDEFYDAVESGLDKMEEEQEFRERLKSGQAIPITPPAMSPATQHRLWPEVSLCFSF